MLIGIGIAVVTRHKHKEKCYQSVKGSKIRVYIIHSVDKFRSLVNHINNTDDSGPMSVQNNRHILLLFLQTENLAGFF